MHNAPSNLPQLIRRMLEPGFYLHSTVDPIVLLQTHISYVLLTGDFVYKVKKPVKLSFLDFSTLEARRHFCEQEVRLNRRGAPGIYLGVESICEYEGRHRLDGGGPPVEYAVKMIEFPQEGLFSSMLAAGKLGPEQIDLLARRVAEYHRDAPTSAQVAEFGAPDRIRQTFNDNSAATRQFVGDVQPVGQFEQTRAFTDRFFAEYRQVLEDRATRGFVRECHGDLHLGNICLFRDHVLLFDCIEFNESFRCIDVIQDAAFAPMDLQAARRGDLANRFINTYAERTGDWQGLQLLPLHLCRQAYVRGKVNALLTLEPEVDPAAREKARAAASQYFHLAWSYSQPRQGRLVLVAGLSGSGKSTLARQLAIEWDAIHIRSDAVRKHLAGVELDEKGGEAIYTAEHTARTYDEMLELGLLLAGRGFTVILDATFNRRHFRRAAIDCASAAPIPLQILYCVASANVLRDRLSRRQKDVSDAGPEILDLQRNELEPFDESERPYVTEIDTTGPEFPSPEGRGRKPNTNPTPAY
jgi:aminoglycoside phosphotransferase family enzyme/predicted kinase